MEIALLIVALLVMVVGLVGSFLPMIPGVPLVYSGYLIYGLASHWRHYGLATMVVFGLIAVLVIVLDYVAGINGGEKIRSFPGRGLGSHHRGRGGRPGFQSDRSGGGDFRRSHAWRTAAGAFHGAGLPIRLGGLSRISNRQPVQGHGRHHHAWLVSLAGFHLAPGRLNSKGTVFPRKKSPLRVGFTTTSIQIKACSSGQRRRQWGQGQGRRVPAASEPGPIHQRQVKIT